MKKTIKCFAVVTSDGDVCDVIKMTRGEAKDECYSGETAVPATLTYEVPPPKKRARRQKRKAGGK